MSKRRIQGITIELEADTSSLKDALKEVDKASGKTTRELNQVNRALKFDEGNTTLLAQKQEVLEDAIKNTTTRLDALKQAQIEVDRLFSKGDIDATAYREFNREIEITQGKLKTFQQQAADVYAKIHVQADTGDLDKAKRKMKELPDEAKKSAKEIGQAFGTGFAVAGAGLTALTLGMQDTNKDLSRLESQAKSTRSSVNNLSNNIQKMSEAEIEALETSLEEKEELLEKSYSDQLATAEKTYEAQEKAFEKSLDNEMSALERSHERKLKLIDNEYKERLKLIDEDEYRRLKAIDAEIAGIEAEQDAVDQLNKLADENAKRLELKENVDKARTKHDKEKAAKALADYEAKLIEQRKADERRATIDSLKDEKDAIKDAADQKKDAVQNEYDLKVEQLNATFEREKESLQELHTLKREQFAEQKEQYLTSIKDQFDEELKLYKEMNAEKVKIAETPVSNSSQQQSTVKVNLDVSDFKNSRVIFDSVAQEVDQASEAIGNLLRAGFETEKDLTSISKSIAGAIQQYGDTFNAESLAESIATTTQLGTATGQFMDLLEKNGMTVEDFNAKMQQYSTVGERANYISDLLAKQGMTEIYDTFASTHPEIIKQSEAYIEYIDSVNKLTTALLPLITAVTQIVTWFANLGAEHPLLAKGFLILSTAVTALLTIFGVLMPVFKNLWKFLGKLRPFLPKVASAFLVLTGPIGWVIRIVMILIRLVPVIIKNWSKIGKFFSVLWKGISSVFKGGMKGLKTIALGLVGFLKAPVNGMIKLLNVFIKGVNKIKIPDWVPLVGGGSFKIPEIPMLARGTNYFKGSAAIVGEEGPELVRMPIGSKVYPNKQTANMLDGSGEITINVPLTIDGRLIAQATAKFTNHELYKLKQRDLRGV